VKEFSTEESKQARRSLIVLQILVGTSAVTLFLITGMAAVIMVFIGASKPADEVMTVIAYGAAAVGIFSLVNNLILPNFVVSKLRKKILLDDQNAGKFIRLFSTKTYAGLCACQGGALLNALVAIAAQSWWSIAIAVVLLFAILSRFPTQAGIENFVREQIELAQIEQGRG